MLGVNEQFPEFVLTTVEPEDNSFGIITDEDLMGTWSVVFFYPKDFTFICPTEIKDMDILLEEAYVVGISGDNEFCKQVWKKSNKLISKINYPLAADCGLLLTEQCGIIDHNENVPLRATFILNPENVVQSVFCNVLDTGRSAKEILRTIQSLRVGELTGCDWIPGEETL